MRFVPAVVVAFLLGLALAVACDAAGDLSRDVDRLERLRESVDVDADRIEYAEGERKIVATGKVRIGLGARSLFADEVSVDLDDQILVATGSVILMEGMTRLEGDRIEYNYRTNLGVITNGHGLLDSGVSFSGVEIRREGERQFSVRDGRFSGCRACQPESETPDWEFRTGAATVYQDDWIASRDSSFWIKGIPAFYFPILDLAIGPRRTGFLIPRVGYGNQDGFSIRQPFFWAISPSQDATFTPIYRTKRGFEIDGQYRYVLAERSRGELNARYLHDLEPGTAPPNRGEVHWIHDSVLTPTWTFKADARYLSDQQLYRSFADSSVANRTLAVNDSNIFATQMTSQYMLLGLVEVTEDLTTVGTKRLSRLPEMRLQWLPAPPLGSLPVVAEGETSVVYFEQSSGDNAGRFDLRPVLHLPLVPFPWLTTSTSVGLRETAYTQAASGGGGTNRFLVDLAQRVGSTFLRRFEDPGFGFTRLTHLVESSVQYQYVPWVDQQSLLQFDRVDFVNPQNRVTYRLANRLMGRTQTAAGDVRTFEAASLSVTQSVNLQPKTREFSNLYLEALTPERVDQAVTDSQTLPNGFTRATERRLSNLVIQAAVRPTPAVGVYGTVAVDAQRGTTEAVNTGIAVQLRDDIFMEAGQSYVRDQQVDGIVARILWKATKNLSLDLVTRYDFHTSTLWGNTLNIRFSTCCWQARLTYNYVNQGPGKPNQNTVNVVFDLKVPTAPVTPRASPAGGEPLPQTPSDIGVDRFLLDSVQ
jgi:LPS-assembly protein